MPQNPIIAAVVTQSKKVTAAEVVKAVGGTLVSIIVDNPGSGGALTLNDVATVGGAGSGNQILSVPFGNLTAGQVMTIFYPAKTGIVVSAVPSGGGAVKVSFA